MGRIVIVPALVAAAVLTSAGPAAAEQAPPSLWAAAAQYVEMIPTSTGPKAAGAAGPTKPLPASLAKQFGRSAGPDANALETLVTSSGWGARPVEGHQSPPEGQTGDSPPQRLAVPSPQESTSLPASVGGGLTSGSRATFALVVVLCLLAASILVRLRTRSSKWAER
jgi:hypothetical protein